MRRPRGLLVVGLLAAAAVLAGLGAPTGMALAAMPGEDPGTVRVALGEANATWQVLTGAPTIDEVPVPETEQPVPEDRIEPWRGYERTVPVRLGGNGSLLVAAGSQGLVLEAPATGSSPDEALGNGTGNGTVDGDAAGSNASTSAGPAPGSSDGAAGASAPDEGEEASTAPSPQDHEGESTGDGGRWALAERPLLAAGLALALLLAAGPTVWQLLARDEGDARADEPLDGGSERVGARRRDDGADPHRRDPRAGDRGPRPRRERPGGRRRGERAPRRGRNGDRRRRAGRGRDRLRR